MKTIVSYLKIAIVLLFVSVAVVCVFSEPDDESASVLSVILFKFIGFAAGYLAYKLTSHWKEEEHLQRIKNLCEED